jgi:tryptophanyl-tRNA synthetase
VTLDEVVDRFLDHVATERGLARKTVEAYARDLAAFTRSALARRVHVAGRITTADVRAHLTALADRGLSPRSQARALAAIRGFLRFLALRGVLKDDPARTLRIRRPPGRLPRALAAGEMGSLLAQPADGEARGLRDRALLELLYACGLRVSEAIALRGTQLDLRAGFVTVLGKGGKERVVPLGRHARAALEAYIGDERPRVLRGRASPFVFLGPTGRPLTRQAVWKLVRRRALAAGSDGASRRTRSATRSRPISSAAAPTCGSCRRSSGTPTSDDADLHARRARTAAGSPSPASSTGMNGFAPLPTRRYTPAMEPRQVIAELAFMAVPVLAAIVFHEVAHGAVAYRCGDPTAARHGRLTLEPAAAHRPVRHRDPARRPPAAPHWSSARRRSCSATRVRFPSTTADSAIRGATAVLVALAGPGTNLVLAVAERVAFAALPQSAPTAASRRAPRDGGRLALDQLRARGLQPAPRAAARRRARPRRAPPRARGALPRDVEGVGFVVVLLVVMNSTSSSRLGRSRCSRFSSRMVGMAGSSSAGRGPTGRQHLGNYHGALKNWVRLQDAHAASSSSPTGTRSRPTGRPRRARREHRRDGARLARRRTRSGKGDALPQSAVKEHAELFLLLGMLTPVPWLERNPTYKEQREQLEDRDLSTYGFLGYPVLQAADVLMYKATAVPVGIDQAPHIELTREIGRRFNATYRPLFPEPRTLLTDAPKIVGTDGRKMSKSYGNAVYLTDTPEDVDTKLSRMVTDPRRARRTDPGEPNDCPAYLSFHRLYCTPEELRYQEEGVPDCGHRLPRVQADHDQARAGGARADPRRREQLRADDARAALAAGNARARMVAERTMAEVREAVGLP